MWSRKPLFGFIEVELVKPFKAWANNPPLEPLAVLQAAVTDGGEMAKQKALDDFLC